MADETNETTETAADEGQAQESGAAAAAPKNMQKIMCFVSKQMVPIDETVEVEYMPHKKVRVLPRYIRYATEETGA